MRLTCRTDPAEYGVVPQDRIAALRGRRAVVTAVIRNRPQILERAAANAGDVIMPRSGAVIPVRRVRQEDAPQRPFLRQLVQIPVNRREADARQRLPHGVVYLLGRWMVPGSPDGLEDARALFGVSRSCQQGRFLIDNFYY